MDSSQKAELIRDGNAAYNEGDYTQARDLFTRAGYKSGLIRLGDYYMYERRLPLLAYGYYKRAEAADKIADLHRRMIRAMGKWLGKDKLKDEYQPNQSSNYAATELDSEGMVGISVSPLLRETALKILDKK